MIMCARLLRLGSTMGMVIPKTTIRVWNEFEYRFDIVCVAEDMRIEHFLIFKINFR